jgi:hypothetical protein
MNTGMILGLVLAGVGLIAVVFGILQLRTAKASAGWPAVKGKIVLAGVETSSSTDEDGSTSRRYSPRVEYAYTVSGRKYTSHQAAVGSRRTYGSRSAAEAKLAYRSGQQVDVYYNPQKPSQAVLEPGAAGGAWGTVIIGIVFAVAGVVVIAVNL